MEFFVIDFFTQADKQKHIFFSALILLFDFIIRYFFIQKRKNIIYAFTFALRDTIIIWFLKEFVDFLWFWTPDFMDLLWNSLGIIFPVYLYFSYKEIQILWKKDFFIYLDDYLRQLLIFLKILKKETKEWFSFWFAYFSKYIHKKIETDAFSDKELFLWKKNRDKEIAESISIFKKVFKLLKYFFIYIFFWILDFFMELIKMPFFILQKTFGLIWKSLKIIFFKI